MTKLVMREDVATDPTNTRKILRNLMNNYMPINSAA